MPSPNQTHGPIVKTGPTAGQVRTRNSDGRWRTKRNDAGKPRTTKNKQLKEVFIMDDLLYFISDKLIPALDFVNEVIEEFKND